MTASTRPDIDLLDPTFHVADPHPAYRWMREHEPIFRDRSGFWCITRMDHLRAIERHADGYVSSQGYRSVWVPTETSMISRDDPEHTEQRRLISDRFTPRAIGRLETSVRELVCETIDTIAGAPVVEVVDAFAARIPSILTCRLIGWDDSHWRDVRSWSERLMRIDTMPVDLAQASDGIRAVTEIARLVDTTLADRRAQPIDDLLSVWGGAELGGCPMSDVDINSELGLLIPGGAETTRTTLARALVLFSERNDLWEQMADGPEHIATAVEELLRWITPLNNMFRTVAADVELDGIEFRAGDRIALIYPSANRDDRVFDAPDDIDLRRDPNPHVAFGFGTHFCLGAHLARLILRVTLEELTQRFTSLRPAGSPVYEANVFVKAVERFDLAMENR